MPQLEDLLQSKYTPQRHAPTKVYSSVLNRSHVVTIWNFDPDYSLPDVTHISLPKTFQIVATWLQFNTEEYFRKRTHRRQFYG